MMRNCEFYSTGNGNKMVHRYALRGVLDERRSYSPDQLLKAQHRVYLDWLEHSRKTATRPDLFVCSFYEWMLRNADTAFVVKPGDLVKYKGQYCLVKERLAPGWCNTWRVIDGEVQQTEWPQPLQGLTLEYPDGSIHSYNAEDESLEPADIPPEVFALACGKAKDCPMLKGN